MFGGPEAEPQWDGAALSKETTLECFMEVSLLALPAVVDVKSAMTLVF